MFFCLLAFMTGIRTPPCSAIPPNHPMSATGIHCKPLTLFALSSKLGRSNHVKVLRRDGDSNPGNPFGVYTLSRRASSTTRASLLRRKRLTMTSLLHNSYNCRTSSSSVCEHSVGSHPEWGLLKSATKLLQKKQIRKYLCVFLHFFVILCQKVALHWPL